MADAAIHAVLATLFFWLALSVAGRIAAAPRLSRPNKVGGRPLVARHRRAALMGAHLVLLPVGRAAEPDEQVPLLRLDFEARVGLDELGEPALLGRGEN